MASHYYVTRLTFDSKTKMAQAETLLGEVTLHHYTHTLGAILEGHNRSSAKILEGLMNLQGSSLPTKDIEEITTMAQKHQSDPFVFFVPFSNEFKDTCIEFRGSSYTLPRNALHLIK